MKYVTISVMFSLSLMLLACSDSQEAAQTSKTETTQPEQTTVQQNEAQQNDSEVQNTEEVSEATPEQPESKDDVANIDTSEQESSEPVEVAKEAPQLDANAGKELYEKQCKICHESGMLGAPKYGNQSEWASHIAKGKDTLYLHSAKGFNKMPPQAVNGVTEAQVQAAVDYMVAGSS